MIIKIFKDFLNNSILKLPNYKLEIILRVGVVGTYLGHGINALLIKKQWIKLITSLGFSQNFAISAMPVIGVIDIIVAILTILKPNFYLFIWATFWCILTAVSRFTAGESFLEVLERFPNIVCPLLLCIKYFIQKPRYDDLTL